MHLLFAYNGPLFRDNQDRYWSNELNDILIDRYRYLADDITFLLRVRKIDNPEASGKQVISSRNWGVCAVPDFEMGLNVLFQLKALHRVIENAVKNADMLVIRLPSLVGRIAHKYAHKHQKPFITEVVGCTWDALSNHSFIARFIAPFSYLATRRCIRQSAFVIYVTQRFLQKRYPSSGTNCGISDVIIYPDEHFNIENRFRRIQDKFNTEHPVLTLCTIGGIDTKFKGQDFVVQTLAALKAQGYVFKYLIVGRGAGVYLKQLIEREHLSGDIDIVGEVAHRDIFKLLDTIDVYVQPSRQDGLPRALVEAMSRGCPAIGTTTGGIPELLDTDYLVSRDNINQLAEKLKKLNRESMLDMAIRNYHNAKPYAEKVLAEKRKAFYDQFSGSLSL